MWRDSTTQEGREAMRYKSLDGHPFAIWTPNDDQLVNAPVIPPNVPTAFKGKPIAYGA